MLLRYEGSVEHPTPPDARGMSVQQTAQTTTEHESTNKAVTARKVTPLIGGPTTAPKKNKQSFDYILKTGIAGGLAGCAAKTVVGPLDRVKILFQASSPQFAKYTGSWLGVVTAMRDINRAEGARGLFRGHSATLLRIFPYAAIKFQAYEQIRAVVIPAPEYETAWRRLFSGSAAGVTSVFVTYPLEVIRVRLAFETKADEGKVGLRRICRRIYHEQSPRLPSVLSKATPINGGAAATVATAATELLPQAPRSGLTNFYRGFSPTLFGMLPYAGVSFLTHDTMHDVLRYPKIAPYTTLPSSSSPTSNPQNRSPLKSWAQLLAGGLAGLVSQTAAYPFEVVRRRMQVGGAVGDGHRLGMGEVTRLVWKERGMGGFFVGLGIGYLKVVPMVAVSFWVYERGKAVLGV